MCGRSGDAVAGASLTGRTCVPASAIRAVFCEIGPGSATPTSRVVRVARASQAQQHQTGHPSSTHCDRLAPPPGDGHVRQLWGDVPFPFDLLPMPYFAGQVAVVSWGYWASVEVPGPPTRHDPRGKHHECPGSLDDPSSQSEAEQPATHERKRDRSYMEGRVSVLAHWLAKSAESDCRLPLLRRHRLILPRSDGRSGSYAAVHIGETQ
jgi:hypothetical protein